MKQFIYTLRYLGKTKATNIIKVLSLTLGLAMGLVIFAQIAFERSYDRFFKDADRLYRIKTTMSYPIKQADNADAGTAEGEGSTRSHTYYGVFYPTVQTMLDNIPEVEDGTTISYMTAEDGRTYYREDGLDEFPSNLVYADSSFFSTMGIEVLRGDPAKDFGEPTRVFISDDFARRFFGDRDPVGQPIYNNNKYGYIVVGVFKKLPNNSHLNFDVIMSRIAPTASWGGSQNYLGYVRLRPGADPETVENKFADFVARHEVFNELQEEGLTFRYILEPIADGHIARNDVKDKNLLLSVVGLCLLLTSVMNYVLISVSSLSSRSRTLAVFKCNGARSSDIFRMFMQETAVLTVISAAAAALFIYVFRERLEVLIGQPVSVLFAWSNLWVAGIVLLVVWVIAGVIPGFVFSSVSVMSAFRSAGSVGKMRWKSVLLFAQLASATFILTFLAVIVRQYNYMSNKDLGYRYDNLVYVWTLYTNLSKEQYFTVREEVKKLPFVENVSLISLGMPLYNYFPSQRIVDENNEVILTSLMQQVDENYLDVFGLELIEGKNLEPGSPANEVLVTEEAVEQLGWVGSPIGRPLGKSPLTVRGVVKGFYTGTALNSTDKKPVIISHLPPGGDPYSVAYIMMRFSEVTPQNIARMREAVGQVLPDKIVKIKTYREELLGNYREQLMTRDSIGLTAIFTTLITLMGLIGYVSYEMRRRRKEIALRKINGATVHEVLTMISLDMAPISLLSVAFGLAAAYYVSGFWLSGFVNKAPMGIGLFIVCGVFLLMVIAGVIVGKAWGAANENPVNALKTE